MVGHDMLSDLGAAPVLMEELQFLGLERVFERLQASGYSRLSDMHDTSPQDLQRLIPTVGTRRKLLNTFPSDCPAAQPISFPFHTAASPSKGTRASTAAGTAFARSPTRGTHAPAAGTAQPRKSTRPVSHAATTPVRSPSLSARKHETPATGRQSTRLSSRSESYTKNVRGCGTEFTTDIGGMARDIELANKKKFPSARSPARKQARKVAAEGTSPRQFSRSGTSKSHRATPVATPEKSPQEKYAGAEVLPPPPPPSEDDTGRSRPVFVTRNKEDIFAFLTGREVNLASDEAHKLEQRLRIEGVTTGMRCACGVSRVVQTPLSTLQSAQ